MPWKRGQGALEEQRMAGLERIAGLRREEEIMLEEQRIACFGPEVDL